jgi:hypothetical protein
MQIPKSLVVFVIIIVLIYSPTYYTCAMPVPSQPVIPENVNPEPGGAVIVPLNESLAGIVVLAYLLGGGDREETNTYLVWGVALWLVWMTTLEFKDWGRGPEPPPGGTTRRLY